MDVYGGLYRYVMMPAWERLRGRPLFERLRYLERSQWEPESSVRALQLMELRRLLVHASERIPYYREVFRSVGFDPQRVQSVGELAALPPLTKEIVRARYREFVDARTAPRHVHKHTSGSSGQPFEFEYDAGSEVFRQAVKWRTYGWCRYRPGMRAFHYWGVPVPPSGLHGLKTRADRALRRERYVDCLPLDEPSLARAAEALRRSRPQVVVGFSIALARLARFVMDRGLRDWDDIPALVGAEPLLASDREAIVAAFGSAFETYGSRETMLLACECEAHAGLHTMDDAMVVEVVVDGRPARPGETGEVLVTDLHNFGMPLIRYRNGDLAEVGDGRACPCGRGLSLGIARVIGRRTDQLRSATGKPVAGIAIGSIIATHERGIDEIQAVQRASGELVLRVVPGRGYDPRGTDAIVTNIRRYLDVPIRIETTTHIDRGPGGKQRLVVVEPPASQTAVR